MVLAPDEPPPASLGSVPNAGTPDQSLKLPSMVMTVPANEGAGIIIKELKRVTKITVMRALPKDLCFTIRSPYILSGHSQSKSSRSDESRPGVTVLRTFVN